MPDKKLIVASSGPELSGRMGVRLRLLWLLGGEVLNFFD